MGVEAFVMRDLPKVTAIRFDCVNFVNLPFGRARLIRIIPRRAVNNAPTIWRPMRMNRIRVVFRHLPWHAVVQIDQKDFIMPGAIGNKRDLFSIG